jgi:hypothetical protein
MNPALQQNNYLHTPGFISAARAAELAGEFLELERQGNYTKDAQAPNSPAAYNFLPFVRLLVEKVPVVSELCGEPVLPTYAYGRIYKEGEVLRRHRDRDACEISFTLNLAHDAEWPIYIEKPSGEAVALDLVPGDAVMYLGCDTDHWRERYTGKNHVQVFLHYVRAYGPRAYTFFNIARTPPGAQNRVAVAAAGPSRPVHGPDAIPQERATPFVRPVTKVGRNDVCPCGSGRKYKHCHGKAAG